jgi:REP element-mobilizing transposase RayT
VKYPIHLCFGILPQEGLQEIVLRTDVRRGAEVRLVAHCIFPNAVHIIHKMDAVINVGDNASFSYKETHYHGDFGGIEVIPKAKGDAARMIEEAKGYAIERVNQARGEAAKFNAIFKEYSKAPEVTQQRIYLETMNEILPKVGRKLVTDKETTGILPLFQIEKEGKKNE